MLIDLPIADIQLMMQNYELFKTRVNQANELLIKNESKTGGSVQDKNEAQIKDLESDSETSQNKKESEPTPSEAI